MMLLALIVLVMLIVMNGVLAMSEIAMVTARRSRLEAAAKAGKGGAAAALALRQHPNRFLSTVQIGITLIGILAGAFGEAAIADDAAAALVSRGMAPLWAGTLSTIVVVGLITYLSLIVGELVPKRVGMAMPEAVARVVAPPMRILSGLASPLVWFLSVSTDVLLRPFSAKLREEHAVTEDDILGMVEQAAESGALQEQEQRIVARLFDAGDLRVRSLMVPRPEIEFLDVNASPERVRIAVATAIHSHFPVCDGGLDDVIGIVHVKDVLRSTMLGRLPDLRTLARTPLFVPETMPVLKLLDRFRDTGQRLAIVVDEYGGLEGLVTASDIVGAILGRTVPEDRHNPAVIERADGSWSLDGSLSASRLKEIIGAELPGNAADYETVGGFLLAQLGHLPVIGETLDAAGYRFEVADMDGRRIDRVLLSPLDTPEGETPAG